MIIDIKEEAEQQLISNEEKIIKTDVGAKDGQNKCPRCGATDISLDVNKGCLRCNYCRHEFKPNKSTELETDISILEGQVIGSGAQDIVADTKDIITFKCSSCGSEVVIDTSEAMQARCHWCRNTLSVNQQIPNGSVPDAVLPFKITKEIAKTEIEKFVGKRKFFAHPKFKEEFITTNIMGVYFPYMVINVNSKAKLIGQGEQLIKKYFRGSGENQKNYYDADLYAVGREFDLIVNGLTVESSSDKLEHKSPLKTTNVINAIMPFDIENCVKWDANYLKGYTSEKRDVNIEQLRDLVKVQVKDIARYSANDTITEYDRGVAWSNEQLQIVGQQWIAAYLPVWLYSYQQEKNNKKVLHYVVVNARTKEVMGSVPIHMPKLILLSFLVELLGFFAFWFTDFNYNWLFIFIGFIYFFLMYNKYRNISARHKYESETETKLNNIKREDKLLKRQTGLTNARMIGANNLNIDNENLGNKILNNFINNNKIANIVNNSKIKKGEE